MTGDRQGLSTEGWQLLTPSPHPPPCRQPSPHTQCEHVPHLVAAFDRRPIRTPAASARVPPPPPPCAAAADLEVPRCPPPADTRSFSLTRAASRHRFSPLDAREPSCGNEPDAGALARDAALACITTPSPPPSLPPSSVPSSMRAVLQALKKWLGQGCVGE